MVRGGSGVIRGDQGGSEQEMACAAAGETYENTQFVTREDVRGLGETAPCKIKRGERANRLDQRVAACGIFLEFYDRHACALF